MKTQLLFCIILLIIIPVISCKQKEIDSDLNIIFLHHSTGGIIWIGKEKTLLIKIARRVNDRLVEVLNTKTQLPLLFEDYNVKNYKNYLIKEMKFPKATPYGWNNFPYDYYNIWVENAGDEPFMEEPTLEILTKKYQVIIFKHCFPVSNIQEDQDSADINSDFKTISNYKLQYSALRNKLHEFPETKFILFTGAAQVKSNISEDEAIRAREFFNWVIDEWDLPGDNIYLWDFYYLETEGELYLKEEYAVNPNNSHPNKDFAGRVVNLLFNRIIDVIENDGAKTQLTGEIIGNVPNNSL